MKQALLLFYFAFIILRPLIGQSSLLSITPGTLKKDFTVDLNDPFLDLEVRATITNNSKDNLQLKWKRVELNKPGKWTTQVCDGIVCYDEIVGSNVDSKLGLNAPLKMAPGEKIEFIFHILPNKTSGSGKYGIDFSLTSKPDSAIVRMNFEVSVASKLTAVRDIRSEGLMMYPNPSVDFFQLKNSEGIDRLVIYNLLGTVVREYTVSEGERYRVSSLPDGIYLVSLIDENNDTVRTLRLLKRDVRP
jgi:hypothetical protein